MSTVLDALPSSGADREVWLRWLPVAVGLLALYVPTYYDLAHGSWNEEHNAHGPLVLAVVVWLFWRLRAEVAALPEQGATVAGAAAMLLGALFYVVGRATEVIYFEAFSQIPMITGAILVILGWRGVRVLWFPLLYLIFLVPLPGIVVDAATGSLKQMVSVIAENLLYHAGYPVARTGVMLTVGQYQLLVADACSGLNSMYSLAAMGLLFLYLTREGSVVRNIILLAAILPIAFAANIVRVMTLVLVTYYLGDEAGQGFLHDFSGILLFLIALFLLFGLHAVLRRVIPGRRAAA